MTSVVCSGPVQIGRGQIGSHPVPVRVEDNGINRAAVIWIK